MRGGRVSYPKELLEKAKFELEVFQRVSVETSKELVQEVERLRGILASHGIDFNAQKKGKKNG